MNNKKVFKTTVKVTDADSENYGKDVEVELAVLRPSPKTQVEAQLVYNKAWRQAEESGNILRRDIDEIATKRGLWNDDKRISVEELEKNVLELEKKLRGGANSFETLEKAKEVALEIRKLRAERVALIRPRLELDSVSCENFADMARTNHLIASTVVYNNSGRNYFKDLDDFVNQSNNKVALDSAIAYYELNAGDQKNESFEEEFLKKYKFTNEDGHLINKDGHLITEGGKLVDKDGRYVDKDENYVDVNGTPVDKDGNFFITFREWDEAFEGVVLEGV